MTEKVNIAIIGMGKMGRLRYDVFNQHGGFNIVALCDTNVANLYEFNEKKYTDWKKCIDEILPTAVIVCTFNAVIPDIVCYALSKDIFVFSEKPPGRNLEDAYKMKSAENASKATVKFGFNHRYHNSIMEAKTLVDSNLLGKIVCIRGVYGKAGAPSFAKEWRNNYELSGGGILLDQGIHMLDLIIYFLGSVHTEKSIVSNLVWKNMATEDSAIAIFKSDDGQIASLHSSAIQWKHKFDMDIICENGYIALNGILTQSSSYGEETITYYKKDLEAKSGKLGRPEEHTLCFDSDESWDYEAEEFYEIVSKNKPVLQGSVDDAVQIMRLIENVYIENGLRSNVYEYKN